ncbi:MAG: GH92 family glycosyl hydrolase [Bacteroidota bacterium]
MTVLFLGGLLPNHSFSQTDYTRLVNPFIGTGGHGHTYPGASAPFGMVQLSPDTRLKGWDGCSGYHYSDSVLYGFSHTHLSGTGVEDYCDVLLLPTTGDYQWKNTDYATPFSHETETAYAGYYSVRLPKYKVDVTLTASPRVGMHRYEFDKKEKQGNILIDLQHRDEVLDSWIKIINDSTVVGMRRSKSWAKDQLLFFAAKFSQSFVKHAIAIDDESKGTITNATGKNIKAYFSFNLVPEQPVFTKVALSAVSAENALMNLTAEVPGFNFDKVLTDTKASWNNELGKIEVKGGTKDQQTVFYTALYHASLCPNLFQDTNGEYRGTDGKTHTAQGFTNYTVFSLWDTHRALHPLMTILHPQKTNDWINTFIKQHEQGGMMPVWELWGNETFCMTGYHHASVIWDAYQKGIRGFDAEKALDGMVAYARSDRFGIQQYAKQGFVNNESQAESASKTLEYAYDDWCISQLAKALKKDDIYKEFIRRAQSYKNLFDKKTTFFRGRTDGNWMSPFSPTEVNNYYTEGNAWHYAFSVPQDITILSQLLGGKEKMANKLNELFTTTDKLTGRDQADVTGLIGQYAQGNEPSHHMAYLYNYVGQPWRTQSIIRKINNDFYLNQPDGLIGNEDCGQMSAWFVLSAMGFYPVCPGDGNYALGTPLFDEVIIHQPNGKDFTIKANNRNTDLDFYVRGVAINKVKTYRSYINHWDITNGGEMVFDLGNKPGDNWGTTANDIPKTAIIEEMIVPTPKFLNVNEKFRNQQTISFDWSVINNKIMYRVLPVTGTKKAFIEYRNPFTINNSCTIEAMAISSYDRNPDYSLKQSPLISQRFYKTPTDKSATILSKLNPMYSAGGPDALIDGIRGQVEFQKGNWQSYYGNDMEVVIDLKTAKQVSYVASNHLQDVRSWIWMPKQVEFFVSADGKTFRSIGIVKNDVNEKDETSQLKEFGLKTKLKTRFVKVVATNYGTIPAWHVGVGGAAHIFVDEVEVR